MARHEMASQFSNQAFDNAPRQSRFEGNDQFQRNDGGLHQQQPQQHEQRYTLDDRMRHWYPFHSFVMDKMSVIPGMSRDSLSSVATVIQRLMAHSGLHMDEVGNWYRCHGPDHVKGAVASKIEAFKGGLSGGITVGYIVSLVAEFIGNRI